MLLKGKEKKKKKSNPEKHNQEKEAMYFLNSFFFLNSYLNLHEFCIKVIELSQTDWWPSS